MTEPSGRPESQPFDDRSLMRAVVERDELALRRLYERYAGLLLSLAYEVLQDWQAAEEVVQDVFVQCWLKADTYTPERGSVPAWLAGMANNRALDAVRRATAQKRSSRNTVSIEDVAPPAAKASATDALVESWSIQEGLLRLSPQERTAIYLSLYGGLTHREIATSLNVPLGTAKTWIRRGMERLRVYLSSAEADYG